MRRITTKHGGSIRATTSRPRSWSTCGHDRAHCDDLLCTVTGVVVSDCLTTLLKYLCNPERPESVTLYSFMAEEETPYVARTMIPGQRLNSADLYQRPITVCDRGNRLLQIIYLSRSILDKLAVNSNIDRKALRARRYLQQARGRSDLSKLLAPGPRHQDNCRHSVGSTRSQ